jgi:predicted DNA-binding transcriptional regulator YafY
MKKIRIRTIEDMEKLPEGEIVEAESCDVKFRLVDEDTLTTKLLISDNEVKIPLPDDVYKKVKDKRILIVPE